ncbi:MAG: right-handed parallel beta-helix repeat-containing protein, partial [Bacteroidales bacterium]|nr:right-handed parallel beta-helix repeat-containing protein [Bacteroidales bacterium]
MLIVLTFTLSLFAEIIYVPDNYSTIQAAVNAASIGDEIIVRDGTYTENITINTYGLILHSENGHGNCSIIGEEHCIEGTMNITLIEGFTFKNAANGALVLHGCEGISELKNCIFEDNVGAPGSAITAWSPFNELSGCVFRNNTGPHTVVIDCDYPLGYNPIVNETIKNNLFIDNTNDPGGKDISIINMSSNYHGIIENNTFTDSPGGIFKNLLYGNADMNIRNCIFYDSEIHGSSSINISYCDFTGSGYQGIYTWGDGNLTSTDPLLCEAVEYECYLLEGSPCIDAGDPNSSFDPDGTRADMGCYPSITDVKKCEGNHYNWVSFPRLDRNVNNPVLAPPVLEQFLDWPFQLELKYTGNTTVLVYNGSYWIPTSYNIKSSLGYKLDPQSAGYHYLLLEGSRLASNYQFTYSLDPYTYHWLGYWLPESQNIVAAFGDLWQYVEKVKAEDWFYDKYIPERGMGPVPKSWVTEGKTMTYGKSYMVW